MSSDRTEPPSVETLIDARRAVEAILLVATDPTPVALLAQLVELPADVVDSMCRELADEYETERRGFQLVQVAGGWRYQTHPDTHPYVERYALEGVPNRLSSAALETLAIVAYKQPISRGQIGAIRGVNVDGVLRTLVQRGYVTELGRDDGPGQATLFGTTPFFLEQVGLMSTDDLPPLGDFVPSAEVLEALEQTLRIDGDPPVDLDAGGGDDVEVEGEVEVEVDVEPVGPEASDDSVLTEVQPVVTLGGQRSPQLADEAEVAEVTQVTEDVTIDRPETAEAESSTATVPDDPDPPPGDPPVPGGPAAAGAGDRGRSVGPGSPEPGDVVGQSAWQTGTTDPERDGGDTSPLDPVESGIAPDPADPDSRPGGAHQVDALAAKFRSTRAVTNGSADHRRSPGDA